MGLLTESVDSDMIRLIGRWQSDTMLRYLHTTSKRFTDGLAVHLFEYGDYALILSEHAVV